MQVSVASPGSRGSDEGLSRGCGGAWPLSPSLARVSHFLTLPRMLVANSNRLSLFLEIALRVLLAQVTSSGGNAPSVMVSAWVQRPGLACKATRPCGSGAPRGTDQGLCWAAGPCGVTPPSAHPTLPQTCSRQHTHRLLQARLCLRGFFLGT